MKKTILTIALAFAFALPFAGTADAYGERWYMVKKDEGVKKWPDRDRVLCGVRKGERLERMKPEIRNQKIYVRIVGDFMRTYCRGWVPVKSVYNMDTTVDKLVEYENISLRVPLFRHRDDVWSSRNYARDRGHDPILRDRLCMIPVGTKMHVFHDFFNGSADVMVVEGPCKGKRGWILSYTLDREKRPR